MRSQVRHCFVHREEQIKREDLEVILEAGNYAPNAGGGQRSMEEWEVPTGYVCQGFVILGYIDGEQSHSKPRKPGRVKIVDR